MMPTITIVEIVETTAVVKAIQAITAIITAKRAILPMTATTGILGRTARITTIPDRTARITTAVVGPTRPTTVIATTAAQEAITPIPGLITSMVATATAITPHSSPSIWTSGMAGSTWMSAWAIAARCWQSTWT
jgi:hypothetical protein